MKKNILKVFLTILKKSAYVKKNVSWNTTTILIIMMKRMNANNVKNNISEKWRINGFANGKKTIQI